MKWPLACLLMTMTLAIGLGAYGSKSGDPLWALLLVCWFAIQFRDAQK